MSMFAKKWISGIPKVALRFITAPPETQEIFNDFLLPVRIQGMVWPTGWWWQSSGRCNHWPHCPRQLSYQHHKHRCRAWHLNAWGLWIRQNITRVNSQKMISTSRTSDFRISGSAISSHKNIHYPPYSWKATLLLTHRCPLRGVCTTTLKMVFIFFQTEFILYNIHLFLVLYILFYGSFI